MLKNYDNHVRIPDEILRRSDLSSTQKIVLGTVIRLQGRNVSVSMSFDGLARKIGCSRSSVKRSVRVLKEKGDLIVLPQYVTVDGERLQQAHLLSSRWATSRNIRRAWAERRTEQA